MRSCVPDVSQMVPKWFQNWFQMVFKCLKNGKRKRKRKRKSRFQFSSSVQEVQSWSEKGSKFNLTVDNVLNSYWILLLGSSDDFYSMSFLLHLAHACMLALLWVSSMMFIGILCMCPLPWGRSCLRFQDVSSTLLDPWLLLRIALFSQFASMTFLHDCMFLLCEFTLHDSVSGIHTLWFSLMTSLAPCINASLLHHAFFAWFFFQVWLEIMQLSRAW